MTLFGAKPDIAIYTMSHTRWAISWFAYTTGAGSVALTTVPGSACTEIGRQQPELGGISASESATVFTAV